MIGDVGMSELLVIFLIALILFGADRIPTLAKGLGKGCNRIETHECSLRTAQVDLAQIIEFHFSRSLQANIVTFSGSPPNAVMFRCTHSRDATRSVRP